MASSASSSVTAVEALNNELWRVERDIDRTTAEPRNLEAQTQKLEKCIQTLAEGTSSPPDDRAMLERAARRFSEHRRGRSVSRPRSRSSGLPSLAEDQIESREITFLNEVLVGDFYEDGFKLTYTETPGKGEERTRWSLGFAKKIKATSSTATAYAMYGLPSSRRRLQMNEYLARWILRFASSARWDDHPSTHAQKTSRIYVIFVFPREVFTQLIEEIGEGTIVNVELLTKCSTDVARAGHPEGYFSHDRRVARQIADALTRAISTRTAFSRRSWRTQRTRRTSARKSRTRCCL